MSTLIHSGSGALERPEDAGKGEAGEVARWLMEIDLAGKTEKPWRDKAKKTLERYRDEKDRSDWQFNILWSNTEVLRPNLYGQTPKADVRPRNKDGNKLNAVAAEVMERAINFCIETEDFDAPMQAVILDYLLTGRAVARERFIPAFEGDMLAYARVRTERWPWDRFRRGPGELWSDVQWVAYEHHFTRQEIDEQFPDSKVHFDIIMDGVEKDKADADPDVFKRVQVWEIWHKPSREVLFLAPSNNEAFLKRQPDPLNLQEFFDCERPLYAIESASSLVPIPEYEMYRDQAKELDRITMRINKLIGALKARGIYDTTISEFKDLFAAGDNEMIPTSSGGQAMAAGGLDKAIWMMPVDQIIKVVRELSLQREQVKQTIYEIMGIGDILRGSSNPNETLGAQQLKAQSGSMRMQRRQRDVQRFVKGLLRRKAEIIAENYTPELLSLMTGINLPTMEQKLMAEQAGQPIADPSWEEVMAVLKDDLQRIFRIDIETDSTIAADQASERQQITELITGVGGFVQQMSPAVQGGLISMDATKQILLSALRRFKMGRSVEEAIEKDAGAQPQSPTPEQQQMMQAQSQLEQQKVQAEGAKAQAAIEKARADVMIAQIDVERARMESTPLASQEVVASPQSMQQQPVTVQFNASDAMNSIAQTLISMTEQNAMVTASISEAVGAMLQASNQSSQALFESIQMQREQSSAQGAILMELAANMSNSMNVLSEQVQKQNEIALAPVVPQRDPVTKDIVSARKVLQ